MNRIFQFPSGTVLDLKKVNSIGAIDKSTSGEIYIPVFFERNTKPVKFIVAFAIGITPEETKQKIFVIFQDLTKAWEQYLLNEPG